MLGGWVALISAMALCGCTPRQVAGPVVLAAASLQEALTQLAGSWSAMGHSRPVISFASSSVAARQAAGGAPADIVITADAQWMDWLQDRQLLRQGSRIDLVGNSLVLVRAAGSTATLDRPGRARLALGDPASVPAGRYARESLEYLGIWPTIANRVVPAENVRAALALVDRGEVELGIVYASDAVAAKSVEVVGKLPPGSHPPIRYPLAILASSRHADADDFAAYLASAEAARVFEAHGFGRPM